MTSGDSHTRELLERGFTVFEGAYDPQWVDAIRSDIVGIYRELGSPVPYAPDAQRIAPDVELCAAGMAVYQLLQRRPAWADSVFKPEIIRSIRGALGQDMFLEAAGCVISDHTRPFFGWHTHVGGVNDGEHRRRGVWPEVKTAERVMTLLYLEDLDSDDGSVLVYPHRVGDSVAPPHDLAQREWGGQIELRCRKGSLLAIEQCTWHAIRKKTTVGLRIFVCCTFAARHAPRVNWLDTTLRDFQGGGELLQSLVLRD